MRIPLPSKPRFPFNQPGIWLSRAAAITAAFLLAPTVCSAGVEYTVNSGGGDASPFVADAYFSGGNSFSSGSTINISGVTDPAPQSVYQSERWGASTYTFPGLTTGTDYLVRLHFAETYHSTTGKRQFHVSINGTQVLTNYDIVAEAGGNNKAVVEEFTVAANPSGQIIVQFQTGALDNAKCSGIEILEPAVVVPPTANLNVDIDQGSSYSGTAAAPGDGTVWNLISAQSTSSFTLANVLDSKGKTTPQDVTISSSGGDIRSWNNTTLGNPNPSALMSDYLFGHTYTVTVSELPAGNYFLYVYAHGDQANQNSTVTVAAANGGGSGTTATTGTEYRNLSTAGALGYSFLKFQPTVGASGTLSFTTTYLNGFQLIEYPKPVITLQPPPSPSAVIGSDFNMTANATGDGILTYQWRKGGVNLTNGSTGNGSTYSEVTSQTLTISNAQAADAGSYDVVVTNPGGDTLSDTATLSTTSTPQAPVVTVGLSNRTVLTTGTTSFSVVVNGTSPLTYSWSKGGAALANGTTAQGSMVSGAGSSSLTIINASLLDAGSYSVTVTNSVGSATSTANLIVNQSPSIITQPQTAIVNPGVTHSLTTTFGDAFPTPAVRWEISSDGINYSTVGGATSSTLQLTAGLANSGFYRVIATNSVGTVTSNVVYFGVPSTQSVTFAPGNNATGIAIDQQLRLVFPSAPKLGLSGALRIRDASNDAVVATIDRSQFIGYTLFGGTIINSQKQTVQGKQMYYLPLAIYGNEVWITLGVNQRLTYGKTYYITMDSGLLVDSSNAAVPAITSSTAWRFSTKSSGPAAPTTSTGPTEITVGMDGAGDFATIQGAADWIPQNNTLPRTIRMKPGIYRDIAYFGPGRNFVTLTGDATDRKAVQLIHLYAAEVYGDGARGMGTLRIDSNDVSVRDMTIDNGAYVAQPNLAGAFAPPAPAFAGPINTVATTGQRLVFDNILLKGGQDTLYTITGTCYFHKSEIWGSVDFIYGEALAVFNQCDIVQIRNTGGPVCAPNTPYAQPYGEVFLSCRFPRALVANGYPYNVGAATTTFMRPWRQDGMTAIINCQLDTHVTTKGWGDWSGSENPCRAREHGSTMIGGGAATTIAQRQAAGAYWLNTVDPDYASSSMSSTDPLLAPPNGHLNRVPVTVDPNDYTLAAIFGHPYFNLDGWMPALIARFTTQPSSQAVNEGDPVIISVVITGTPAPTYQWYKDSAILTGETTATLSLASVSATDAGSYTVVATNAAGSVESAHAELTVTDPYTSWADGYFGATAATDGAPGTDFDHDGIVNRLEFFLGSNPKIQDAASILPTAAKSTSGPNALIFVFRRNKTADAVVWSVESNSDLGGVWNTAVNDVNGVTIHTITDPGSGDLDLITVTIPTAEPRVFARLRID
jgi:pectin methylesterase-like acyl-CoA thioesterase